MESESVKPLIRSRAVIKRKITLSFKTLDVLIESGALNRSHFNIHSENILSNLEEVKKVDNQIVEAFETLNLLESNEQLFDKELNDQLEYNFLIKSKLDLIKTDLPDSINNESLNMSESESFKEVLLGIKSALKRDPQPPALKCATFSGVADKDNFHHFLSQFNNLIDCRTDFTDSAKLSYLKGYLTDYSFSIVKHLTNTDENYSTALRLLREEFLDVPFIIDSTLNRIREAKAIEDFNYSKLASWLNEIRAYLYDLRGMGVDFWEQHSSGSILMANIVFGKVPISFKTELIHLTGSNYPGVDQIFDNYIGVIRTLERLKPAKFNSKCDADDNHSSNIKSKNRPNMGFGRDASPHKPTLQSFKTEVSNETFKDSKLNKFSNNTQGSLTNEFTVKICKLCQGSHSMLKCTVYNNSAKRNDRCAELKLCSNCSSSKHLASVCPAIKYGLKFECVFCRSRAHISALCPVDLSENK